MAIENKVNLQSACVHFVPELVISVADQLKANRFGQRDLQLETISPSSQPKQIILIKSVYMQGRQNSVGKKWYEQQINNQ